MGFNLGFRAESLGFRFSGFRVWGLGFQVETINPKPRD